MVLTLHVTREGLGTQGSFCLFGFKILFSLRVNGHGRPTCVTRPEHVL